MKLQPWQEKLLFCLLLGLLTAFAWRPVARCDFVALDDSSYVTGNPQVQAGLTLDGLGWAFRTGHSANWHPVTWLSHMLDAQLYGSQPAGHHLTNLALHLVTTLLLFLVFSQMTGALWRSALVAALFSLHPLHVESVAWVSERKDLLSALFFMLTLWAYGRYAWKSESRRDGRPSTTAAAPHHASRITHQPPNSDLRSSIFCLFYLLSLTFFALGLMSKPMLVTVPFVLLLLDYWPLGRFIVLSPQSSVHGPPDTDHGPRTTDYRPQTTGQTQNQAPPITHHASRITPAPPRPLANRTSYIAHRFREKLPFFLLAAISSVVTCIVQRSGGAVMSTVELPLSGRVANALVSYARYIAGTLWPANLACFYPRPEHWPIWQVAGAALLLGAITALVLWRLSSHRYMATGWFWFLGMLVPVIGLVQVGEQALADRYTYIPSIGLFILAAWGLGDIASRWPRLKPWLVSASAIVLAALVAVTRGQIPHWQNSEALFRHALAVTKDNAWVHCLLADILADAGNFDEAGVNCREALRLKPGFPEVEILHARILVRANKQDQAIAILSRLVQQVPADPVAHDTLGLALSQDGDLPGAIAHYRRALDLKPDYAGARFHLAALLAQQGDAAGAIDEYRQGLRWQPDDPEALNNLAWIRAANANPALRSGDEAVHLARRACELTRYQNPMLAGTLAAAYAESGRFDEAVATAQKARDLALASKQKDLADRNRELLELYRARQPYHEPPPIAAPSRQPIARQLPPAQGLP